MARKILVYGTLRVGQGAYFGFGLNKSTKHLGTVRIPGTMYHMGGFPGVRLDGNPEGVVCDVLEITAESSADTVVEHLDGYEGYHQKNPDNSLYLRKVVTVDPFGEAYIYEINRNMGGYTKIETGDWMDERG